MLQTINIIIAMVLSTLIVAVGLILTQRPRKLAAQPSSFDFEGQIARSVETPIDLSTYTARDGQVLNYRHYPVADKPLLVLVHGSGWHGLQFDALARRIANAGLATVLVPDLRGHGVAPKRRGDIEYIGQLEDDLADLIALHQTPRQVLVMGGASSGGGLVTRFAGGSHGHLLDHALLFAPFLYHRAPTLRANAGGWSHVLLSRMVGLTILNAFRIRILNHLTVIQFAMPDVVLNGPLGDTATLGYSYRLNTSYAPRGTAQTDIAALPMFDVIVGDADEAMIADAYEPYMAPLNINGSYHIVPGGAHLGIENSDIAFAVIDDVLTDYGTEC